MIKSIGRAALWLDMWLEAKLGRTYHVLLGIGLIEEIIHGLKEFNSHLGVEVTLLHTVVPVAVSVVLLIHQVGVLSHLGQRRHAPDAGN